MRRHVLSKQNRCLDRRVSQPLSESIVTIANLFVNLEWHLDVANRAVVDEPIPKLGHHFEGVVISGCIDQDIRIEKEEH